MDKIESKAGKILLLFNGLGERQILLLFIGITFALRLYAVLMAQGIANDSAAYGFMARDFLKGDFEKGLSVSGHPLYPLFISLFSFNPSWVEIVGRLISLFFGTFSLIPLYYLIKKEVGQREATLSAFFYIFHPYLVTYSGMMLTEAMYWGWLILSVYYFWTGLHQERIWRMGLSSLFLGLSYLTRPEGIGYILVYLAWVILYGIFKKSWIKTILIIGSLISVTLIMSLPYILYIHKETGQWLLSQKALRMQSKLFPKEKGKEITLNPPSQRTDQSPLKKKDSKITWIFKNVYRNLPSVIYHYLRAYHFSLWLFLFFGLIRIKKKIISYELFLASMIIFHLMTLATFIPSTIRLSVPMIPLSLLWAGRGVQEMKKCFEKIKILKTENIITILVTLAILIQLPQSMKPERSHRASQREIGLWLKQNTPPESVIMSNTPQEVFYGEREFVLLPLGVSIHGEPGKSYEEILRLAKERGVKYILINKDIYTRNPNFIESIKPTDLKEIFQKEDQGLRIYEVVY